MEKLLRLIIKSLAILKKDWLILPEFNVNFGFGYQLLFILADIGEIPIVNFTGQSEFSFELLPNFLAEFIFIRITVMILEDPLVSSKIDLVFQTHLSNFYYAREGD